ncbi:hypothetical protein K438DRAFT_1781149 [Mycena galopus ATCC 62051]|nr:hypothetical protein K438DRAFT_1781149 [Mycena galopus ATCC 62051]
MNGRDGSATQVHTPAHVTLANSDSCSTGDSVVYEDSTPVTYRRIGLVVEIVQILGSAAEKRGAADFVLVSPTIFGEPHELYNMRRLQSINKYMCLNIAHNCADNKCVLGRSRIIYQEREKTEDRSLAVEHFSPDDRIHCVEGSARFGAVEPSSQGIATGQRHHHRVLIGQFDLDSEQACNAGIRKLNPTCMVVREIKRQNSWYWQDALHETIRRGFKNGFREHNGSIIPLNWRAMSLYKGPDWYGEVGIPA